VANQLAELHRSMDTKPIDTKAVMDRARRVRRASDAVRRAATSDHFFTSARDAAQSGIAVMRAQADRQWGNPAASSVADSVAAARNASHTRDRIRLMQTANDAFWRGHRGVEEGLRNTR